MLELVPVRQNKYDRKTAKQWGAVGDMRDANIVTLTRTMAT